jgi:hypothetical protein
VDEVRPIQFGEALKVSLDNYYDLLKTQVGGLGADEFLQLKLVADPVDLDDAKYRYWSNYNLLNRSDVAIEPVPVSGTILTSADQLNKVYGRFLQRLRKYAVKKQLTPAQQAAMDDLDMKIQRNKDLADDYADKDYQKWTRYCQHTGKKLGDTSAYIQWSINFGYSREISNTVETLKQLYFDRKTIEDQQYADPEDREVVDAEFDYNSLQMRLRYPNRPDYEYSNKALFSWEYFAQLPEGSSAIYDDRRAITWNVSVATMMTTEAGGFAAHYDHATESSSTITTDWGHTGSVGYGLLSVNDSISDHKQISEDFKTTTSVDLAAKSAYKSAIVYPAWFRAELFRHKRVKENIRDFEDFFGPTGVLRYYPIYLILVRGFSSKFENAQAWTYDYDHKFDASVGGGFNICGINFGGNQTYGSHTQEHKIDTAGTTLKIADAETTLRFVGYVVKKNTLWDQVVRFAPIDELGHAVTRAGYNFK